MDDFTRHRLLSLHDIGLTPTYEDELEGFENTLPGRDLKRMKSWPQFK
ncbi:hypothetical protein [Rubrobacter aplysinae]|nr:hypothetical protein [Rubrobacter aplysinae]